MLTRRDTGERGVAMSAAIALLVLGAFIAAAIIIAAMSSRDSARDRLDNAVALSLSKDAAAMLSSAYSSMASGEQHGFVPPRSVFDSHAAKIGGTVVENSSLPGELSKVDDARVPAGSRVAVRVQLEDGMFGFWQLFSVRVPEWGTTPGGRVSVYVRSWGATPDGTPVQPAMTRLELRPAWFADFQFMVDGPIAFGDGATINGPVHSNGYETSFYDIYSVLSDTVSMMAGSTCDSGAHITTGSGTVGGAAAGSCAGQVEEGIGERHNLLRGRSTIAAIGGICTSGSANSLNVRCVTASAAGSRVPVRLSGTNVTVNGSSISARVEGTNPSHNQGAVVVVYGDIELRGALANNARATIIAASPPGASALSSGSAPSVWINNSGTVGKVNDNPSSSVGIIAEGDIIANHESACPLTIRGATMTLTGMVSMHPTWRVPYTVAGGTPCNGMLTIQGSVVGHFPPLTASPANNAGYADRTYTYLDSLFNNPPPLYPTSGDWETSRIVNADLDCFDSGSLALLEVEGCV